MVAVAFAVVVLSLQRVAEPSCAHMAVRTRKLSPPNLLVGERERQQRAPTRRRRRCSSRAAAPHQYDDGSDDRYEEDDRAERAERDHGAEVEARADSLPPFAVH